MKCVVRHLPDLRRFDLGTAESPAKPVGSDDRDIVDCPTVWREEASVLGCVQAVAGEGLHDAVILRFPFEVRDDAACRFS